LLATAENSVVVTGAFCVFSVLASNVFGSPKTPWLCTQKSYCTEVARAAKIVTRAIETVDNSVAKVEDGTVRRKRRIEKPWIIRNEYLCSSNTV
jgi:hypothetical protein